MTPFHTIAQLPGGKVVKLTRSDKEFNDVDQLRHERQLVCAELDKIGRVGRCLLVDSRQAPINTDERLADEFNQFRTSVSRGYDRVGVLVRSKIGILQAKRLSTGRNSQAPLGVFDTLEEAVEYLNG